MRGASAQGTDGASESPLQLNSFFVAPNVWTKFSIRHSGVSYSEFLTYRAQHYQIRNEFAKRFFAEFSKDSVREKRFLKSTSPVGWRNVVW
jgi:hypothetical protein